MHDNRQSLAQQSACLADDDALQSSRAKVCSNISAVDLGDALLSVVVSFCFPEAIRWRRFERLRRVRRLSSARHESRNRRETRTPLFCWGVARQSGGVVRFRELGVRQASMCFLVRPYRPCARVTASGVWLMGRSQSDTRRVWTRLLGVAVQLRCTRRRWLGRHG